MTNCDPSSLSAWYALYTRHQHEKSVAEALCRKGLEAYLPLYVTKRKWKDRIKKLSLPLFPSYVFLHAPLSSRFEVLNLPGVCQFVRLGGLPCAIPPEEMDALRRAVNSQLAVEPHPFLKCSDRVRLVSGPLTGMEGILVRYKSACRLVISIEMLNRSVSVEVSRCDVERLVHFSSASYLPDALSTAVVSATHEQQKNACL